MENKLIPETPDERKLREAENRAIEAEWRVTKLKSELKSTRELKTLHDEVAIAALQGILSCAKEYRGAWNIESRVEYAFEYADEFLKQRNNSDDR